MVNFSQPDGLWPGMVATKVAIALSSELKNERVLDPSFEPCFEGMATVFKRLLRCFTPTTRFNQNGRQD